MSSKCQVLCKQILINNSKIVYHVDCKKITINARSFNHNENWHNLKWFKAFL